MHIEYLYYFRDFSKSLSISKTAAEYYMTPQGLSRALHQLEKDFGITLMAYNNNAVTLTPAGKELAERVEGIIAQYDDARGALTKYKLSEIAPSQGIVRVTVTSCVSRYLLTLLGLQQPGLFPFAVKVNEANIYRLVLTYCQGRMRTAWELCRFLRPIDIGKSSRRQSRKRIWCIALSPCRPSLRWYPNSLRSLRKR